MTTYSIEPQAPDLRIVAVAAGVVRQGGVIIYPTETVYGLGGDGFNRTVSDKIYALKGRDKSKPLSVIIPSSGWVERLTAEVPVAAQKLMKRFWPGPLTMVLRAGTCVPLSLQSARGTIALRLAGSLFCTALADAADCPLIATSANRSGAGDCTSIEAIPSEIKEKVDLIIDGGPSAGQEVSTIIDMTVLPYKILRAGAIRCEQIDRALAEEHYEKEEK